MADLHVHDQGAHELPLAPTPCQCGGMNETVVNLVVVAFVTLFWGILRYTPITG